MSDGRKMTRRDLVERLLAGIAAGAVWPAVASSHPIHALLKDGAALDRADAAQSSLSWKPLFLRDEQHRALVALSEAIVPGSAKAEVSRFIDLLLSVDTREHQEKFSASLAMIDKASQQTYSRGFAELAAGEKEKLLTLVSDNPAHDKDFDAIKEWVVLAYYSSEDGMRELGWTSQHAFRVLPECATKG